MKYSKKVMELVKAALDAQIKKAAATAERTRRSAEYTDANDRACQDLDQAILDETE